MRRTPSTPSSPPGERPGRRVAWALAAAALYLATAAAGCRFDRSDRWLTVVDEPACEAGQARCNKGLERCTEQGWTLVDDCAARGLLCDPVRGCAACSPGELRCQDGDVFACRQDGQGLDLYAACDRSKGLACQQGTCIDLCGEARRTRSNTGCEYWAADLDNAALGASNNAAGQQFAVVVSNPQFDVPVSVTITQDDGAPGDEPAPEVIAKGEVAPNGLRVFKLGPREVDGSPDGEFDTGTGTALTRKGYRVVTDLPVVAYQFNPLENASVFSNDASLLKPVSALGPPAAGGALQPAYVVVGWPQTIARTDDPSTNFGGAELRAFLTILGTRPGTKVRVRTTTRVIPGGPIAETPVGGVIEATLDAYDVLNLETGDFNADFTGSLIEANGPVVVFSGSEASDAPIFKTLGERFCCADHLEDQLDPIRTAGTRFVAPHGPSRTRAVAAAGAPLAVIDEPDYFRVVAAFDGGTTITTTLPPPDDSFVLPAQGSFRTLTAYRDFLINASGPVMLGNVSPSQEAAGIKRGLPGGDPSLLIVPPIEQWRSDYVFLTPDKYSFDFVTVVAPPGVEVRLDGDVLTADLCEIAPADGLTADQRKAPQPPFLVYRCQISFATIDPDKTAPNNVLPGEQNDGVHRVTAAVPVGVLASGFDSFVSYSYAAGTELKELVIE